MEKKLSSYQKLKLKYHKERQELINDIILLVEKDNSFEGLAVKMNWRMRLDLEKMVMAGIRDEKFFCESPWTNPNSFLYNQNH